MESSWTTQLIGKTVETVEQLDGKSCVVTFSDGYRIQIESLWRLLVRGEVTLTSKDEGEQFGRSKPTRAASELRENLLGRPIRDVTGTLLGQPISNVVVMQGSADLILDFGSTALQVVSDSSRYEAWKIEGPAGLIAIGQGGGKVAVWE